MNNYKTEKEIQIIINDMKKCFQIPEKQTVWQHGQSVKQNLILILDFLLDNKPLPNEWLIPSWLAESKNKIVPLLYPRSVLEKYALFHDLGKPYCQIHDEFG
jgi:hypothetical protein